MLIFWRKYKLIYFASLSLASLNVQAVDYTYILGASVARHENVNLEANPEKEEWVETVTGTLVMVENSPVLVANVRASLSSFYYQNRQQNDSVVGALNAAGRWIITPKQFEWFFSDVFTQTTIDPLQSNIASNRQDANTISTGPNYFLRLNPKNNLNLEARAGRVNYSNASGDNSRQSSAVRWLYQVNSVLTESINWEVEKLNFDDSAVSDYVRSDLYARIDYEKGRNTFAAEAGITNIDYELQNSTEESRYLLSLDSQRTRNSNIQFLYSHKITDTGTAILSQADIQSNASNSQVNSTTSTSDVYLDDMLSLRYTNTTSSGSFNIDINKSVQDYKLQNTLDSETVTISVLPVYNFSQISLVSFEATQTKTNYINVSPKRTDLDNVFRLTYSYNLGRHTKLDLMAAHLKRESTNTAREYKDNQVMLTLTYISR